MFYNTKCPRCGKVFFTFNDDREVAAETLYEGLEEHMKSYGEQEDSHFYHEAKPDTERIYEEMEETDYEPSGGYEL